VVLGGAGLVGDLLRGGLRALNSIVTETTERTF